jgi:hypothetical protein
MKMLAGSILILAAAVLFVGGGIAEAPPGTDVGRERYEQLPPPLPS